jgi:signal transduction histidine kinase
MINKPFLIIFFSPLFIHCFSQTNGKGKEFAQPDLQTDSFKYVDALNRAAISMREKNPDSIFYYAKEAREIAERLDYSKGTASAMNNLGIVYAYHNNPQLALHYFNDAYNLYQNNQDTVNEAMLLMNMSLVLVSHDKKEKAFTYINKALLLENKLSNDSLTALVSANYILNFVDTIPKEQSKSYLEKAKLSAARCNNERITLLTNEAAAAIYFQNHQPDSAISLLQEMLAEAVKEGSPHQRLGILEQLGNYFFKTDTLKALPYFKQALDIAESGNYDVVAKRICGKVYNFYASRKDVANTALYAAKLIKLNRDEEARNNISGIDYLEYALKDQQLEEANIKNRNREIIIIALSTAAVLFIVLLSFIYRLYRLKKEHAATLQKLNIAVLRKNEQLQSNHAFNNTIISILAHDFRQPLIAIGTLSTLLKNIHSLSQERLDTLIETMEDSAETSLASFKNILQYIKPQLAGFVYEPASFNLQTLINEVVQPFLDTAEKHHIKLQNMVAENVKIEADKEMIQFINRNLIHNAVKFAPQNSTVTISAKVVDKEIIVSVDDEGKGISKDSLAHLFYFKNETAFEQRKEKGAGVALIICKDLIERMNGRIWAENSKEKGAIFCYALPLEAI